MKNLKLVFVFILLFILNSNQLLAQKKWVPYAGYVAGKGLTVLKFEGKGALIGITIENPIKKKRLFFDYGLELTYLLDEKKLGNGLNCVNCSFDPVLSPDAYRIRYLELSAPILLKFQLLEKNRSALMVKSGYAPTVSYGKVFQYRFLENSTVDVERYSYKVPTEYIHTYYFGLDYRFTLKENFAIELSPILKYQVPYKNDYERHLQYGLAARTVFSF